MMGRKLKGTALLLSALLLIVPPGVSVRSAEIAEGETTDHEHDWSELTGYQEATTEAEGYEQFTCPICGETYTVTIPKLEQSDTGWQYGDLSEASVDSLTVKVAYFGENPEYVEKQVVLSLDDIMSQCEQVIQSYSYITSKPGVAYDAAQGVLLRDVLELAGVDVDDVAAYQFEATDGHLAEYRYSNLFARRYFYPSLGMYWNSEDGITDEEAVLQGRTAVEPMLAIYDNWQSYESDTSYDESRHRTLSAVHCFRLLFGQTKPDEQAARESTEYIKSICVMYSGSPGLTINNGQDMELEVGKDGDGYTVSAAITAADDTLKDAFTQALVWSSSDESVVKIDSSTGKITVVGAGTATITASAAIGDTSVTQSITVNVSDQEDLESTDPPSEPDGSVTDAEPPQQPTENEDVNEPEPDLPPQAKPEPETGSGSGSGAGTGNGETDGSKTGAGTGRGKKSDTGSGNTDGADDSQSDGSGGTSGSDNDSNQSKQTRLTPSDDPAKEQFEETLQEQTDKTEQIAETEETSADGTGKTLKVRKLSSGSGNSVSGGGSSSETTTQTTSDTDITLELTEHTLLGETTLFTVLLFAAGSVLMYIKYKREI